MKSTIKMIVIAVAAFLGSMALNPIFANAQQTIKYSCSNQIYHAFDQEKIEAFFDKTNIKVEVSISSSESALYRLMNNFSGIASTARKLDNRNQHSEYYQIPLCRDPIAVITHAKCGVSNISADQLRDIFAGRISNWQELGGSNFPVMVVVPGVDTAAYRNFTQQLMQGQKIEYDFMAYDSTMATEAVAHFPCGTISFVTRGAVIKRPEILSIKIDGRSPSDRDYPYFQEFYYVTKGKPTDAVKAFIDFSFSDEGQRIMKKKGVVPVER